MDEYLRRYHKQAGDEPANAHNPASSQPTPVYPQHTSPPANKPMFPVNTEPPHPEQPHQADLPAPRQLPVAKHQDRTKRRFGLVKILAVLIVLALAGAGSGFYYLKFVKAPTPLPKQLIKSTNYPVYYPSKLPGSYQYQASSAASQSNLFTYKIADGSNGVFVTEQAAPKNIDLTKLPNFKTVDVGGNGTAVIGNSNNVLTLVYVTPTTLVNMTALNRISQSDMISIAQSLTAVKQ